MAVAGMSAADRGKVTSFLLSALRGNGKEKYEEAVEDFSRELSVRGICLGDVPSEELDWLLAEKIVELFEEGDETTMNLAKGGLLVAAMSKMRPHEKFRVAWKTLDVWRQRAPPAQAPVIAPEMAFAAAVLCLTHYEQPEVATAIVICFCGLMRMSEALQLTNKDVLDCGHAFVLVIGVAKRGMEQKVLLSHPSVLHFLRNYGKVHSDHSPDAKYLPVSYNKVQRWLQRSLEQLGFPGRWTTHGLRRGGATELLRRQVPVPEIALMGRWQSEKSMREYLRKGEVAALRQREDIPKSAWVPAS